MPKKINIESYGTPETTKLYFDDVEQKDIINFKFNVSVDDIATEITVKHAIVDTTQVIPIGQLDQLALNKINDKHPKTEDENFK